MAVKPRMPESHAGEKGDPPSFSGGDPTIQTLINVTCPPSHKLVDPLRELANAVGQARYTVTVAQHLALATNELVENAVLYGTLGADFEYSLSVAPLVKHVSVKVSNNTVSSRIGQLTALSEKLKRGGARQALDEGLRSASRGMGRSQLGLARVVYEASMELVVDVNGPRVTVTAIYRL